MSYQIVNVPNRQILDKEFLSQIVGAPVQEYSMSAGAKAGDNFMGTLLSLDVKTCDSNDIHHLIIKSVLPMTGMIHKNTFADSSFIADSNAFPKEIVYYKRIRPLFQELFQGNKDRLDFFSSPKFYSSLHDENSHGLNDHITLQDLRPHGFKMPNKLVGLNREEMTAALKCLALLHSTSYYLLNGKSSLCNKFQAVVQDPLSLTSLHGWDKNLIEGFDNEFFFNDVVTKVIKLVQETGQGDMAKKMEEITKNGQKDIIINLWNKTTDQGKYFRVFLHGDLWTNNVLVKYSPDGKSLKDVKFIDYQMNRVGNIYEDLQYFIFCSSTPDFRKTYLKACLQDYYNEFESVLQDLAYPMPTGFTVEQLNSTFHETLNYGFAYVLLAIPYQLGQAPAVQSSPSQETSADDKPSEITILEPEDAKPDYSDYHKIMGSAVVDLQNATRNSPTAMKRLDELIKEMIDFGLIQ